MKIRESGMPDEPYWASFFQADAVLDRLALASPAGDIVEFGCGYGTFTLPAARRSRGNLYAFDIEGEMVAITQAKTRQAGLRNVHAVVRDFLAEGTGLAAGAAEYAMLFNILHCEDPLALLTEARRVLRVGGLLGMMHWRHDASTPRGPSLAVRPHPEQCSAWAVAAGFEIVPPGLVDLPPYHYGLVGRKRREES